ncbi:hypothetical protein ACI2KG_03485 [Pseudomonas sp. NPDC089407]|uniref:hypothetical protein n=1 Tax=Pseudomonas sp. NPDC089407 TaxID=3364464 RepID=UPI003850525C
MRIRGNVYWTWVDPTLHHRSHEETLDGGVCIDVQVRLSRRGVAQMFVGVYARSGMALHEEAFYAWPKASQARALAWGVMRARGIAEAGMPAMNTTAAWSETENIKPGSTRCTG